MFNTVLSWIYQELKANARLRCKMTFREDQTPKNVVVYFDGALKLSIAALAGIDNAMSIESLLFDNGKVSYGDNIHQCWEPITGERQWESAKELVDTINSILPCVIA